MKFGAKDGVVFGITSAFFILEAMIHYSIGKSSQIHGGAGKIRVFLPGLRDFLKIILVVIIFSALSMVTIAAVDNAEEVDKAAAAGKSGCGTLGPQTAGAEEEG
jgi:hypothetical protein